MQHIGIVACSAEGAALCYRTICVEGAEIFGVHAHPEVTMHTPSFAAYVACLNKGDWAGVSELMLSSANKLAQAGADFLICPDNTIHQAFPRLEPVAPLPCLHIAEVVANEAEAKGFKCLALTGTRWLVESEVYPEKLSERGIAFVRPAEEARIEINRIFQRIIGHLKDDGCDAVVLGCTEIPLIINDNNSPLPTLDSTRLLARAALRRAASGT